MMGQGMGHSRVEETGRWQMPHEGGGPGKRGGSSHDKISSNSWGIPSFRSFWVPIN